MPKDPPEIEASLRSGPDLRADGEGAGENLRVVESLGSRVSGLA